MSPENGKTMFEEAAAERELEELRRAIEESRARRRDANAAFDEFVKSFGLSRQPPLAPPQAQSPPPPQQSAQPQWQPPQPEPQPPAPPQWQPAAPSSLDDFPVELPPTASSPLPPVRAALASTRRFFAARIGTVAGLGVAAVLAVIFMSRGRTPQQPAAAAPAVAPPARGVPAAPRPDLAPAATAGSEAPPSAEISTSRLVWLRVVADGVRVVEREVPADTKIPLRATSQIVIRMGDAGAVRVSIGGKDQGLLGPTGQAVTRTFAIAGQPKNR